MEIAYKKNATDVFARLEKFYNREMQNEILVNFKLPSETLKVFGANKNTEYTTYPDPNERIKFWDSLCKEKIDVEDDSIPNAYLSEFDQGLYGALIGGDVRFLCNKDTGWISSMIAPEYDSVDDFKIAPIDRNHKWFQIYLKQLKIYAENSNGKFGISHFILIDSLNFIFELVGATKTYYSLYENFDKVKEITDFAYELNVEVMKALFENIPLHNDGTFSNFAQWLPGKIVSESLDPFHLTSVDDFETFGREPIERIFKAFDGGVIHIHSNGRHLVNAASSLKGLKAIYLLDEKDNPPAFDVLDQLRKEANDVPIVVPTTLEKFLEKLAKSELHTNILYNVQANISYQEANKIMEKVRKYKQ